MRTAALVAASGILYALALPPVGASLVACLALVPLIVAVRHRSAASALYLGAFSGYVAGWCVQWWFAETVRQYFALSPGLATVATMASVLVVWGLPFALFAVAVALLSRRAPRALMPVVTAAAWVSCEFLRTRLTGQAWGLLGYSQYANLPVIQIAEWTGVYGVSFVLALTSATLVEVLPALGRRDARAVRSLVPWLSVAACVLVLGSVRLTSTPRDRSTREVVVVQAGGTPARHWTRRSSELQLRTYLDLTRQALATVRAQLIVWPENSVTRYPERDPILAARLAALTRMANADLLFGAPRVAGDHVFNSLRLLRPGDPHVQHYDKRVLVPFAEASVLRSSPTTGDESPESFTSGTGSSVVRSFVPLGVSICHEVLHPELINRSVRDGAGVLVNIANDGLVDLGYDVASAQHAAMAVFRAVETRRFLVRAAATGPSLVIDPFGRVIASLPAGRPGSIVARVGERAAVTVYVRAGDAFALTCLVVVMMGLAPVWAPRRRVMLAPAPS